MVYVVPKELGCDADVDGNGNGNGVCTTYEHPSIRHRSQAWRLVWSAVSRQSTV